MRNKLKQLLLSCCYSLAVFLKVYLTEFAKTWLQKFQVHFNNLTSEWNGKQ